MAYKTIELERDGDVAIIRLNDPATLNAVTVTMIEEIDAALDEINGAPPNSSRYWKHKPAARQLIIDFWARVAEPRITPLATRGL